jgi:hypothetical protein
MNRDTGQLQSVDMLGASTRRKYTQNTSAATHIQDHFVFEQVGVLLDGDLVGLSTDLVFEHIFVDAEMTVGIEVIIDAFFHGEERVLLVERIRDLESRVPRRTVLDLLVGMILHEDFIISNLNNI